MSTAHAVRGSTAPIDVPTVLPVVTMTVAADGMMTVAVDGTPLEPPQFGPPWVRTSFAEIIERVLKRAGSPVRVLVYEADGTVFTDLITQPLRGSFAAARRQVAHDTARTIVEPLENPPAPTPTDHLLPPPRVVVGEEGFLPGEEVAVAIVVRNTKASVEGSARALLEPGICRASVAGEVLLVGRTSGTLATGNLT